MTGWRDSWLRVWLGGLIVGVVTFLFFGFSSSLLGGSSVVFAGIVLAALVALAAWWMYRRGQKGMALGIVGGYALLSLISTGQCTLLLEPDEGLEGGAIVGFFLYPALLIAALIIGGIATAITRARHKEDQP